MKKKKADKVFYVRNYQRLMIAAELLSRFDDEPSFEIGSLCRGIAARCLSHVDAIVEPGVILEHERSLSEHTLLQDRIGNSLQSLKSYRHDIASEDEIVSLSIALAEIKAIIANDKELDKLFEGE
jgi:hypothetical protein